MSPPPDSVPPPELVQDQARFDACMQALAEARELAIDTEADSFFSYREKVCLVQLSALGRDWVIDPLARIDIRGLGELLADPERVKVFHDGEYDVLILRRDFGFSFRSIFDTRIAAAALGNKSPGLAAVLKEHFDLDLDKSLQRSDWSQRPLSAEQIEYARFDTHYLIPLMHLQRAQLDAAGRMQIALEEARRLERLEPPERRFDPDDFARLKGARTLDRQQLRALRELFVWREEVARERDVPPFKILGNEGLLALARSQPGSPRQLAQSGALSPRQERSFGAAIAAALARARTLGPLESLPRTDARDGEAPASEEEAELIERLKQWRKATAEREGLETALVLNRHPLQRIARERPRSAESVAAVEGLLDWQRARFSEELAALVQLFERELAAGTIELGWRRRRR